MDKFAYFDNLKSAMNSVNAVIESKLYPAAIDFMDNNAISTVEEYSNSGLSTDKECLLLII